ncbi:MAG: hypothetical protein V1799_13560 [bacterium]
MGYNNGNGTSLNKHRWIPAIICVIIGMTMSMNAQEMSRQAFLFSRDSMRVSTLSFERLLNTFLWDGGLYVAEEMGGLQMNLQQHLRSRLIRAEQRAIQDEYQTTLNLRSPFRDQWNVVARLSSSALSDNQAVDLNKLAQHSALLGFEVTPARWLSISGLGGYEVDAQQGEQDRGFSYLVEGEARSLRVEEFTSSVNGRWQQAVLSPRTIDAGELNLTIEREFGDRTKNVMGVSITKQRREFYTRADEAVRSLYQITNNIFQRNVWGIQIADSLRYQLSDEVEFLLEGAVLNRTIDRGYRYKNYSSPSGIVFNTRIQEFQLFGRFYTRFELAQWVGMDFMATYQEREESHGVKEEGGEDLYQLFERQKRSERRLENVSRRTALTSSLRLQITPSDSLNVAGSASILRYDTPDTLNIDDRDELLLTFGISSSHRINRYLTIGLSVDATLAHLVYLNRLQSASNNWNRILRFAPSLDYTPASWIRSSNRAEVLANYTVFDFEDAASLTKSFSFRQAAWSDSTTIVISNLFHFHFVGEARVYQRGILLWDDFKERPQGYFIEQTYWSRLLMKAAKTVQLGVGFRFFRQDRYSYRQAQRRFEQRLETNGPTVSLSWTGISRQQIMLEGWNESQSLDGKSFRTIPNLSLSVSMEL